MMYSIVHSKKFKRQYNKLQQSNPDLFRKLNIIIGWLAEQKNIPAKNNNHRLFGDLKGYWECHVAPDWLLIYRYHHNILVLELVATGSHSDLF